MRQFLASGIALGAAGLSLLRFAPRYWLWPAVGIDAPGVINAPELNRAWFTLGQLHDPWASVSHFSNQVLTWRLFWPVLGHYTAMPDTLFLAIPFAGAVVALAVGATIVHRRTGSPALAVGTTILLATSSWYFVSTGWLAYFDSWLAVALLVTAFAPGRAAIVAACAIAPWIDERFLFALPLCAVARLVDGRENAPGVPSPWARDTMAMALAVAPYLAVRLAAESLGFRQTSEAYLAGQLHGRPDATLVVSGVWQGVRFGWVFAVAAATGVAAAARKEGVRPPLVAAALVAALGAFGITFAIAGDLSRSASLVTPLVVAGVVHLHHTDARRARWLALACAAANLLVPAEHVVTTFQRTLKPLTAEVSAAQAPPGYLTRALEGHGR